MPTYQPRFSSPTTLVGGDADILEEGLVEGVAASRADERPHA